MNFKSVYFIGIGGIGMSALARHFLHQGLSVAGYDRTATSLTAELEAEGAKIHFEDSVELIGQEWLDPATTIVVFTPAVPADHSEYCYFCENGFEVVKRSQMLGYLSANKYVMAVAGTHGKSSTSTMISWLNHQAEGCGSAFLGAISRNFNSNLVLGEGDRLAVEADEFDRSFLRLNPDVAVITSVAADHLDIYGTYDAVKEAFAQFVDRIKPGGSLIIHKGVDIEIRNREIEVYRYSFDGGADFYADRVTLSKSGDYTFDIVTPDSRIEGCTLSLIGWVNIENAVAAVAAMWCAAKAEGRSINESAIRSALAQFEGVKRRFEIYIKRDNLLYMDDYAHHPEEIEAALSSVRRAFGDRHITAVFQPHLYTRTRDHYEGFAKALSIADKVVILPIYPARELPIEGVSSEVIASLMRVPTQIVELADVAKYVADSEPLDIVVTIGAGSIDTCCEDLAKRLIDRFER